MQRSVISKLSTLINEGGSSIKIEGYEEVLVDAIEETVKEESFYKLPTDEVLKIVQKSHIEDIETIFELISRMNEIKQNESILLLNVIKREDSTFEECIKFFSKFEQCPICKLAFEHFEENENLPERDYSQEIDELKEEIKKLRERNPFPPVTEKPSDFETFNSN